MATSQRDYPEYVVLAMLRYHTEIESFKLKTTPPALLPTEYIDNSTSPWWDEPGHTLHEKGPKTTRVPHNSFAIVEKLCDMTADIALARKHELTPSEDIALLLLVTVDDETKLPQSTKEQGYRALDKVVAFLNR